MRRLASLAASSRFVVSGDSMLPNFDHDQYILVRRLDRVEGPRRGDVVVFQHHLRPGISLLKRVVGLPGDRVRVTEGRVYVDGRLLEEPYLHGGTQAPAAAAPRSSGGAGPGTEWTLHEGQYFVLGDNRSHPHPDDSRRFGPVEMGSIVGAAWFRYWPPSAWGRLPSST